MLRFRVLLASTALLLTMALPIAAIGAGGPPPSEQCVPGTVWEDQASGVKYLCIYDEVYGGSRWVLLPNGQRGSDGTTYGSSSYGCLRQIVGLSGLSGGGADVVARTYRWPCTTFRDRIAQPPGEIRSRIVIQRFGGAGWTSCRDSGYAYNTSTAFGWIAGIDMGTSADCGSGSYRALGFGSFYQGGLWRGGSLYTPSLWLP